MNVEKLNEAINGIDESLAQDAVKPYRKKRRTTVKIILPLAASLVFLAGVAAVLHAVPPKNAVSSDTSGSVPEMFEESENTSPALGVQGAPEDAYGITSAPGAVSDKTADTQNGGTGNESSVGSFPDNRTDYSSIASSVSVVFNSVAETFSTTEEIALMSADFIPLSADKLADFYGTRVLPTYVPQELAVLDTVPTGYYKRGNDIYYSQNSVQYASGGNYITVCMNKDRLPFFSMDEWTGESFEHTDVSGVQVTFLSFSDAYDERYAAVFIKDNTGFDIRSTGVSKEDFIKTVMSILT